MIFCAEELRATACVVVDALIVRGWNVSLETGTNARKALALSLRTPRRGLRVVCLPQRIDKKTHRRLLEGLDGDLRKDLLLVPLLTPRAVIEAIELREGIRRQRPARRYTKAYLPYPTIAESRASFGRLSGVAAFAVVGAAAVAFGLGSYTATPAVGGSMASSTPAPVVASEPPSRLLDDAVYSAAVQPVVEADGEPYPARRRRRPRRAVRAPDVTAMSSVPDEDAQDVIVIEEDSEDDAATDALLDAMAARHRASKASDRTVSPISAHGVALSTGPEGHGLEAAAEETLSATAGEKTDLAAMAGTGPGTPEGQVVVGEAGSGPDADELRDPWPTPTRTATRPRKRKRVGAPRSFRRNKRKRSVAPVDPFASNPL